MPATITIRDESTSGQTLAEWAIEVLSERITVRELIRSRVYQEVQDFHRDRPPVFRGMVQPSEAEQALNGCKVPRNRQIDWKQQFDKAVEAFEASRLLILVGNRQAESLEEEIEVRPGAEVTFLRLVPLVGG